VNSKQNNRCLFNDFYHYVDFFLIHSPYEFREILTVLYNSTRNLSAAKRVTKGKMKTILELVHHGQSFNFNGATIVDAGGRSAQTFPLVHVSSPSYDRQNCSATCRRNISSRVDVSMNINATPSLLPNCRKLFLSLFYFFCKGRSNIGKNAKTALCQFCAKFSKSGPGHIRKGRRSADRPPIGIEVE